MEIKRRGETLGPIRIGFRIDPGYEWHIFILNLASKRRDYSGGGGGTYSVIAVTARNGEINVT